MQPDEPVYDIKEKEDTNDIDILEEELYMEESMQPDEPGLQPHPERKDRGVIGNNWKKRKNGRGKDPCIFLPRIGCGGTDSWFYRLSEP